MLNQNLGNDSISCDLGCMCAPKYITIYKGYDTYFNGHHLVHAQLIPTYPVIPTKYKFIIGGIEKVYENVQDGFYIDLDAKETATLPLGPINGNIIAVDAGGNETPMTTAIPFIVENWVQGDIDVQQVEMKIYVKDGDTNVFQIKINSPYFATVLHNDLQQRDANNCHPIKSITGLQDALDSKQDVIPDLEAIRAGAALGDTSLQPSDLNNTALTGNTTAQALKVGGYNVLTTNSALNGGKLNIGSVSKTALSNAVQNSLDLADSAVQEIDTGSTNGTISVDGTDVEVAGLGSAAFTDTDAYATAAQGAKADSAIQTVKVNGTALTPENNAVNVTVPTIASDVHALPDTTTIYDLTSQAQQDAIDSGASSSKITQITTNQNAIGTLSSLNTTVKTDLVSAINEVDGTAGTALQPGDVINTTDSTVTNKPLSANMGKSLQDQIDNLKQRGHFLSLWNCATGLAQSNPPQSPYTYQAGDYFIIGTVASGGGTNYKPSGSSYTTGVASTTVETQSVDENDIYYYDGTNWLLQINTQKTTTFGSIEGDPYDNSNLASALNAKQDELVQGTGIAIDSSTNTISNSGVRGISTGSTNGTISVNTNGTSAEVSVAGLGSAAFTNSSAYATAAQGEKADSAVQTIAIGTTNGTINVDGTDISVYGLGSAAYTPSSDYATAAQGAKADTALQNKSTGDSSVVILGNSSNSSYSVSIGYDSNTPSGANSATAIGCWSRATASRSISIGAFSAANARRSIAIGGAWIYDSTSTTAGAECSIAIGSDAITDSSAKGAIQIGKGTNSEAGSVNISLTTDGTNFNNYKVLGSDGKIPNARLTISTSMSSSSTDSEIPSLKLLYDTVGDIETLLAQV